MAIFAYDPAAMKAWANETVKILNGGDQDSFQGISKKFDNLLERLVQPNVWTGAAAKKNYDNFLETHQAMINFLNLFGNAFEDSMNKVNQSVASLEVGNLGSSTNVGSTFGTLSFDALSNLCETNINIELVTYDYATISSIGEELHNVEVALEGVGQSLVQKINRINDGTRMWDGDAAASARETLVRVANENMNKINDALNVCIANIARAASAASAADKAM